MCIGYKMRKSEICEIISQECIWSELSDFMQSEFYSHHKAKLRRNYLLA